jgi:nucleoside-diphosphate-sugar epimerase
MLDKGVKNDDFNICGNNTYKIGDLAKIIWTKVNLGIDFPGFKHLPAPPSDVRFRIGVSEKAKRILNWEPKYDLDYIIEDTLQFIRTKME